LRSSFGAVQDKGQWRCRWNSELYKFYDGEDLAQYIKADRLRWAWNVIIIGQLREFDTRPERKKRNWKI
jgi:hypothetical protein